jgi:di-N-acetylchitobiase
VDNEKAMKGNEAKCQTLLLKELRQELNRHPLTKAAQIVFDISWAPRGIDGRYYDWKGLTEAVDFFFVMSYDMRSQIYYQCIAGANAPLALVRQGLEEFLYAFDIPASKLVLGVAWYGYKYPCIGNDEASSICTIKPVPFFGAPCSDAAGVQLDYAEIRNILKSKNVQAKWDEMSQTPYLVVQMEQIITSTGATNSVSQIWYDDLKSLGLKYALAKDLNLRGVGMWHGDSLDYLEAPDDSQDMWRALHIADPDEAKAIV